MAVRVGNGIIIALAIVCIAGQVYAEDAPKPVEPNKDSEALELPALPEVPEDATADARDALDKSLEKKAPAKDTLRKRAPKRGLSQRKAEREKQDENKPETNKGSENSHKPN